MMVRGRGRNWGVCGGIRGKRLPEAIDYSTKLIDWQGEGKYQRHLLAIMRTFLRHCLNGTSFQSNAYGCLDKQQRQHERMARRMSCRSRNQVIKTETKRTEGNAQMSNKCRQGASK